jgi:hypothetical protein
MKLSSFMTVLAIRDAARSAIASKKQTPHREELAAVVQLLEADLKENRIPAAESVVRAVELLRRLRDRG